MHEGIVAEGETASLNRIARLMKVNDLQGWPREKHRRQGLPNLHPEGVKNLVERNFSSLEPETR